MLDEGALGLEAKGTWTWRFKGKQWESYDRSPGNLADLGVEKDQEY